MAEYTVPVAPREVNCPVCDARKGQSCFSQAGFTSAAHYTRQIAAIAAFTNGELRLTDSGEGDKARYGRIREYTA